MLRCPMATGPSLDGMHRRGSSMPRKGSRVDISDQEFLAGLTNSNNWQAQQDFIHDLAKRRAVGRLAGIASQLIQRGRALTPPEAGVLVQIEDSLALTGTAEALGLLLRLPPSDDRSAQSWGSRIRDRELACRLASSTPASHLVATIDQSRFRTQWQELLACWVQEAILRGHRFDASPPVLKFWRRLRDGGHPLSGLPLQPLEMEQEISEVLPQYGPGSASYSPWEQPELAPLPVAPEVFAFRAQAERAPEPSSESAISGWVAKSNGRVESRLYDVKPERPDGFAMDVRLRALDLACLRGAGPDQVSVRAITPGDGFSILFGASAHGGAYDRGENGAYGRLNAWRSIAGLVGARPEDETGAIEAEANASYWYSFDAESEWFCHVAWDVGLMVIRKDRRTMAILAATDTD